MSETEERAVTMAQIEGLTQSYAEARAWLAEIITELEQKIQAIKAEAMPQIRTAVAQAQQQHDALRASLAEAEGLFVRPKTRVFAGVRVGYKQAGTTVEWDDEAAVIKRIRERLPKDQAELLIRRTEKVHKPAVYDLEAADLRRLGIRLGGGQEDPYIKAQDSELTKLVDALLSEAADTKAEARS